MGNVIESEGDSLSTSVRTFLSEFDRLFPDAKQRADELTTLFDLLDLDEEEPDEDEDDEDDEGSGAANDNKAKLEARLVLEIEEAALSDDVVNTFSRVLATSELSVCRQFSAVRIVGCSLSAEQIATLFSGLARCPVLRVLDLSGNALSIDSVLFLSARLRDLPASLSQLHLAKCDLGNAGCLELLKGLYALSIPNSSHSSASFIPSPSVASASSSSSTSSESSSSSASSSSSSASSSPASSPSPIASSSSSDHLEIITPSAIAASFPPAPLPPIQQQTQPPEPEAKEKEKATEEQQEQRRQEISLSLKNNGLTMQGVQLLLNFVSTTRLSASVKFAEKKIDASKIEPLHKALKGHSSSSSSSSSSTDTKDPVTAAPIEGRRRAQTILPGQSPKLVPRDTWLNTPSERFRIGRYELVGHRPDMQDTTLLRGCFRGRPNEDLLCVFDGHGTRESSEFCAQNLAEMLAARLTELEEANRKQKDTNSSSNDNNNSSNDDTNNSSSCKSMMSEKERCFAALRTTFAAVHTDMKEFAVFNGTTAVVVLIIGDNLYMANVGDSRAILSQGGRAVRLSVDHKPSLPSEVERIAALGGVVTNGRVKGMLAISRALGDHACAPFVTPEPHLAHVQLTKDDPLLVLACDGLFDVTDDQLVVSIAGTLPDPTSSARYLAEQAIAAGSTDNVSVVVAHLL